jgi:hypothetical protein
LTRADFLEELVVLNDVCSLRALEDDGKLDVRRGGVLRCREPVEGADANGFGSKDGDFLVRLGCLDGSTVFEVGNFMEELEEAVFEGRKNSNVEFEVGRKDSFESF